MSQPALDLELPDAEPTFGVAELIDVVNGVLRKGFGDGVWVRGEIQGWSERNGHAYFRLVERLDEGTAAIDVSFFANSRRRLRPLLERSRLRLADGVKVRIFGAFDVYAATGRLSLKMSGIDPRYTLGELAMRRDEVVRRLVASGRFDANRRLTASPAPLRVGVVTSVGSAAWHDFHDELVRSGFGFSLSVVDVRVQGAWALDMVTGALRTLGRRDDLDVIALVRGGGSRTDLAVFDEEAIAEAIVGSAVPVLTGLGHEIDQSVADLVAHRSFKTPTACAAALVERVRRFVSGTEEAWASITRAAASRLERSATGLDTLGHRIRHRTVSVLERADARTGAAADRVRRRPGQVLQHELRHLEGVEARVRALDPARVLARGWSITRAADGRIVTDASTLGVGDRITTTLARGQLTSEVSTTSEESP